MSVGVRELKDNLSRYLSRVGNGEEIVVTDRGRAVAKIVPIGARGVLDRLIAEGAVVPAEVAKQRAPARRLRASAPVSDLVADQRR